MSALQVIDVKRAPFHARGDGVTDDTDAIQAALSQSGPGRVIRLPPGTYRLRTFLTVPSFTELRGAGNSTVLKPLDDSADEVNPLLLLKEVEGVTVRALSIDGNARNLDQQFAHAAIALVGARRCLIKHISTVDMGKTADDPGGAHILITANEATATPRKLETRGAVPSEHNVIESCSLKDTDHIAKFAIRLLTYWWLPRPDDAFTAMNRYNTIRDCRLNGFFWNTIEIAGPATRRNVIADNRIENALQVALEADKAAKRNLFVGNRIMRSRQHPDPTQPNQNAGVTAMRDQGFKPSAQDQAPQRFAEGNVYVRNIISGTRQTNAGTNGSAAGILFWFSKDAVFVGNEVRVVAAAGGNKACGIATRSPVERLTEHGNRLFNTGNPRCTLP